MNLINKLIKNIQNRPDAVERNILHHVRELELKNALYGIPKHSSKLQSNTDNVHTYDLKDNTPIIIDITNELLEISPNEHSHPRLHDAIFVFPQGLMNKCSGLFKIRQFRKSINYAKNHELLYAKIRLEDSDSSYYGYLSIEQENRSLYLRLNFKEDENFYSSDYISKCEAIINKYNLQECSEKNGPETDNSKIDDDKMDADLFICHASEDKESFVRPLAEKLQCSGITVWYDEFTLQPGDNLRRRIDEGLVQCRFALVVLSPSFFEKEWTQYELDGLIQMQMEGTIKFIPIWYNITSKDIRRHSPSLANIVALKSDQPIDNLVSKIKSIKNNLGSLPGKF